MTMSRMLPLLGLALLGFASAQTPTNVTAENHPILLSWKCTVANGCVEQRTAIVLDALAHPVHQIGNPSVSCGSWGAAANAALCPDAQTCAENCVLDPVSDYSAYGISTDGGSLTLKQMREDGSVVSPRVYLLAPSKTEYEMLQLTGGEIAFDVDISTLPCGMNGALYLSEMNKYGGESALNRAGAYHGSGYCDAQCFVTPFINGVGNIEGKGSCCNEMDIWEGNARAQSIAPHPCNKTSLYECVGDECAFDGVCDKWGCTYNPYGLGNHDYYGLGLTVDTSRPFTVVTQFPAGEDGRLKEIRRLYVQDGVVIQNAAVASDTSADPVNYISDEFCAPRVGDGHYMDLGATPVMGDALSRGMVLAFSIWWDEGGFMQWLDGGNAGPCNATEGDPKNIKEIQPDTAVTFSNVKWGEIGSTYTSA
ncbi:endoglucanase EG-1 [Peziza echinospora]|nr:endoglucanase EG-1 [Peziza echinospora]